MTRVMNFSAASLNSNKRLKYYTVEVVTFDNESFIVEVEAHNEEEAQDLAASQFDDVDYTMIQGCFAGW